MRHLPVIAFLLCLSPSALSDEPGKPIFARLCVSCHGLDGSGNPEKAKVLKIDPQLLNLGRKEAAHLTRAELRTILLKGKNKMPAYEKKLKPGEWEPILDYVEKLIHSLRGKK